MRDLTSRYPMNLLSRRGFLAGALSAAAIGLAPSGGHAAQPIMRTGKPFMKLSLAAYSFNRVLPRRGTPEEIGQAKMTLEDFVDYCAELDLDACEPTSYYFPKEISNEYLMALKERAFRLGLAISGTAIGNDFCLPEGPARDEQLRMMREWIDYAAALGAPHIRIFAGKVPEGDLEEAALERCIAGINESLDYAAQKGVVLGLENHGGITATPEQMLRIVKGVKDSPWFGVNFDSGNFRTADPYGDLEKIAPYTVNAQIKVAMKPNNGAKEPADLARVIKILRDVHYRGYVVLEYEEEEEPKAVIPGYIEQLRALIHG